MMIQEKIKKMYDEFVRDTMHTPNVLELDKYSYATLMAECCVLSSISAHVIYGIGICETFMGMRIVVHLYNEEEIRLRYEERQEQKESSICDIIDQLIALNLQQIELLNKLKEKK